MKDYTTPRGSRIVILLALLLAMSSGSAWAQALSGITFAGKPNTLFVGVRKVTDVLGWSVHWEQAGQTLYINDRSVTSAGTVRRLPDGTALLAVSALRYLGGEVVWDATSGTVTIKSGGRSLQVTRGAKRVEVDCTTQRLRAWQGDTLLLETAVSTGRSGSRTPTGEFTAGPYKSRMHYSGLYNDAPMPYSVQVNGNVFIHGFGSVPRYPASHGCIRVPLNAGNPARWFYEWVDRRTPIRIKGRWQG
ncbi:L,D-transpeptidase family protein [Armatimonas sp.]|uniref:L,D-transpeptidase family protein n=1 Tax=Armatimonas sp. TaxID=1872638 RepID=UPI0037523C55